MPNRGIEFKPDAADPKRVKLTRGLPAGIVRAEITYRVDGGLRGTRVVRASEAEFAYLRTADSTVYDGSWSESRRLWPYEAQRYIEDARKRIAAEELEIRRRREAVDVTCPWCGIPRTYVGVVGFVTGHAGPFTDKPMEWGQELVKQHIYCCDRCGSTQYFADGYLDHPLPGRPPEPNPGPAGRR